MLITDILARNVARRGRHPFIRHADTTLPYAAFDRQANRAGNALRDLGIRAGDRVTLALHASVEYLTFALGALKAGAVLHGVDPLTGIPELTHILHDASPALIVTAGRHLHQLVTAGAAPTALATIDDPEPSGDDPSARLATPPVALTPVLDRSAETRPPMRPAPDDLAMLSYSSGTTGPPRGVLVTHRSLGHEGACSVAMLGIHSDDTILAVAPLSHPTGWHAFTTALHAAATIAFADPFRAADLWDVVSQTGATVLYAHGPSLAEIVKHTPSVPPVKSSLSVVLARGATLVDGMLMQHLAIDHVADCFASTELGVVAMTPVEQQPRAGAVGRCVPDVQIRILDAQGRDVPTGSVGEIAVHTPHRTWMYANAHEEARRTDAGWFCTEDLGRLDDEDWLYLVDRNEGALEDLSANTGSRALKAASARGRKA